MHRTSVSREIFDALADDGDISVQEITELHIRESIAGAIEALLVLDRFAANVEGEQT